MTFGSLLITFKFVMSSHFTWIFSLNKIHCIIKITKIKFWLSITYSDYNTEIFQWRNNSFCQKTGLWCVSDILKKKKKKSLKMYQKFV